MNPSLDMGLDLAAKTLDRIETAASGRSGVLAKAAVRIGAGFLTRTAIASFGAFSLGLLVGGAATALLTPVSGERMRRQIAERLGTKASPLQHEIDVVDDEISRLERIARRTRPANDDMPMVEEIMVDLAAEDFASEALEAHVSLAAE
ncbi:hypothetical protein BH09MYX1_BH09MYX1_36620 [soil metagenome]